MAQRTENLILPVTYDDEKTDLESLSNGIDILIETAMSTPGILDDYGPVEIGGTLLGPEKP